MRKTDKMQFMSEDKPLRHEDYLAMAERVRELESAFATREGKARKPKSVFWENHGEIIKEMIGVAAILVASFGLLGFLDRYSNIDIDNQAIADSCFDIHLTQPGGPPLWVVRGWRYVRSKWWLGYTWEDNEYPGLVFRDRKPAFDAIRKWGWKICDPVHPE